MIVKIMSSGNVNNRYQPIFFLFATSIPLFPLVKGLFVEKKQNTPAKACSLYLWVIVYFTAFCQAASKLPINSSPVMSGFAKNSSAAGAKSFGTRFAG